MLQKEELDELWFKPYDEECYSMIFQQINFSKYILVVLTDPNFNYFEQHAYENKSLWQSANVQYFQFLEILNDYFDISTIDEKIVYIEDKEIKKITGKFRLWIDCQRLYCLQFFGLYHIEFGQDRLTLSLFRSKKALYNLLSCYKYEMFEENQFYEFLMKTKQQLIVLSKNLLQDKKIQNDLINEIIYMLTKFQRRERIFEKELISDEFRRINKEILAKNTAQIKQIESMLLMKIRSAEKMTVEKEEVLWKEVPIELMKQRYKKGESVFLEINNKQDKSSIRKTNKMKTLNKSSNNPKDDKNVAFYSNFLSYFEEQEVNMIPLIEKQKKGNMRESSNQSSYQTSNNDEWYYYDESFIQKIKNANNEIAKVKNEDVADLNEKLLIKTKKFKEIQLEETSNKMKDMIWKNYSSEELQFMNYQNKISEKAFLDRNENKIALNMAEQEFEDEEDDLAIKNKPIIDKFLYAMQMEKAQNRKQFQKKQRQNKFSIYKEAKIPKYQRLAEARWGIIQGSEKKIIALKKVQTTQDLVFWQKIPRFARFIRKKYTAK